MLSLIKAILKFAFKFMLIGSLVTILLIIFAAIICGLSEVMAWFAGIAAAITVFIFIVAWVARHSEW